MRKKIITGVSALYLKHMISEEPKQLNIEMPFGFNPNKMPEFAIFTQNIATIDIGTEPYDDKYDIYSNERLFVEFEKIPLDDNLKEEALNNLSQVVNPQLVNEIYSKIHNKRRGLNHQRIQNYLDSQVINIKDALLDNTLDKLTVLREYIMALLAKINIPCQIIKGGFAIEFFIDPNQPGRIDELWNTISNRKNAVYFKPLDQTKLDTELLLTPYSKSNLLNDVLWMNPTTKTKMQVKLYVNTSYNNEQLTEMLKNSKKVESKIIKNASYLIIEDK